MDILLIGPVPPKYGGKSFGGIATHIEGLAEELSKKGHNVSIWNYKLQRSTKSQSISIIGNDYWNYLSFVSFFIITIFKIKDFLTFKENILLGFKKFRLKKILNAQGFSVIHVHSVHDTAPIAIREIEQGKGTRVFSTDHGFWQCKNIIKNPKIVLNKLKNIAFNVDKIVYISDYAHDNHLKYNFSQIDKLVKIPNPISNSKFSLGEKSKEDNKRIIFFNGLSETITRKRLDLLLAAINNDDLLKDTTKVIVIVNKKGRELIKSQNYNFEIECYGPVPMSKVDEFYSRSHIMVLPSISESFGLVYIEALIRGVPFVGFDKVFFEFEKQMNCYIGEAFSSKNNDPFVLAEKIKKVLNYNFDFEKLQSKSIEIFSWKNRISDFEKIYSDI